MASKADQELTLLLTKLYTIQEDCGAKPKTSKEEKEKAAENVAKMGKGKKANKTGSRFLELKSSIVDKLRTVHQLLQEAADREAGKVSVAGGNNPKEIIAAQATVREHIRQMQEEWQEMDGLYKNEARKKRSKFTQQELEVQQTLVLNLQNEIDKVKEIQQRGFMRGAAGGGAFGDDVATQLNTKALAALDSSDLMGSSGGGGFGGGGGGGEDWAPVGDDQRGPMADLSDGQRVQIQEIDNRDAEFDRQIDEIGVGIQDLAEIAQMQGEEVKRQNAMLDNVGNRIENLHDQVNNVNSKMKDTLNEVGRSSDKLCVDVMCILLAVGFAAVLYNMFKRSF